MREVPVPQAFIKLPHIKFSKRRSRPTAGRQRKQRGAILRCQSSLDQGKASVIG
jgi:hypothetical protein